MPGSDKEINLLLNKIERLENTNFALTETNVILAKDNKIQKQEVFAICYAIRESELLRRGEIPNNAEFRKRQQKAAELSDKILKEFNLL